MQPTFCQESKSVFVFIKMILDIIDFIKIDLVRIDFEIKLFIFDSFFKNTLTESKKNFFFLKSILILISENQITSKIGKINFGVKINSSLPKYRSKHA